MTADVVFLLDVDNTLLDGDRIVADLRDHLKHEFGDACAQRYWAIFDALRKELGYVDYLGALQRYRIDADQGSKDEQRLLMMSSFLIDYPFADRLYAGALEVITHLDGDSDRWRRRVSAAQTAALRAVGRRGRPRSGLRA
jgi:hypothetical protein